MLPAYKWADVYRALKPFVRPFGESGEGRLDFYHRSLSKAVRKKYVCALPHTNLAVGPPVARGGMVVAEVAASCHRWSSCGHLVAADGWHAGGLPPVGCRWGAE